MTDALLAELNDAQREAVTAPSGPVLVLAGAGSGKTRAICHRIAWLIQHDRVPASNILAVTFTNKAAAEMRARVRALVPEGAEAIWLHTFHALSLRLLRFYGETIGLPKNFSVYDEDDRRSLLRRTLRELGLAEREFPVSKVAAAITAQKNLAERFGRARDLEVQDRIFARYQELLEAASALDFDDLLSKAVLLLSRSDEARAFAERRFHHVLVDEYQDTNRVQYRLLKLLAPHGNVFVVGDEDQSIYNFRGADLRNILDFERDYPAARVVRLEENYRSTRAILDVASAVIGHNVERKGKRLIARVGPGSRPRLYAAPSDREEAAYVASSIATLRAESEESPVAVLYRTHAQSRLFEEELLRRGIPHVLVGGQRFYERREVKDALAYLRLLVSPDDPAAFLRVVNTPPRGVGPQTVRLLESAASSRGVSLWEAADALTNEGSLGVRAERGVREFRDIRDKLSRLSGRVPLPELVDATLRESGVVPALLAEGTAEAASRVENLQQLVAAAAERAEDGLGAFLDSASLLSDLDAVKDRGPVLLLTLHSAKGLEFDAVFLTGLEEGLFPHVRSAGDRRAIEEERRLCYVGMTRARKVLVLTYAEARAQAMVRTGRTPSRFLLEVPGDLVELVGPVGHVGRLRQAGEPADAAPALPSRSRAETLRPFHPGTRVEHPTFGVGTIVTSHVEGGEQKLTVRFARVGQKKLLARYAGLTVLGA